MTPDDIIAGKVCPYCGTSSEHVSDTEVYNRWYGGMIYLCRKCDAYVGCHKTCPNESLGRLANKELREAKIQAHLYLDNLWSRRISSDCTKGHARGKAYKWLSQQMGIDKKYCHIGMFDVEQCNTVVKLCKPYFK